MKLNGLLNLGRSLPAFDELAAGLREGRVPTAPVALYHAAQPYLVAALAGRLNRPLLIITPRTNRAPMINEPPRLAAGRGSRPQLRRPRCLVLRAHPLGGKTRQRRLEALVSLLTWEGSGAEGQGSGRAGEQRIGIRNTHHASRITLPSWSRLPVRSCR